MECLEIIDHLIDGHGNPVVPKVAFRGKKYIVIYFSASYCTHFEALLRKLKKIHMEAIKRRIGLEVVYVSSDTDQKDMLKHFKERHGKWLAVPFGNIVAEELRYRFGVTSIPLIAVIKDDGTVITTRGKAEIEELGLNVLVSWTD